MEADMSANVAIEPAPKRSFSDKMLDGIERVGNKVPHPVLMFLYLIIFIIVLSHILYLFGVNVTENVTVPVPIEADRIFYEDSTAHLLDTPESAYDQKFEVRQETISVQSLLTVAGI